MSDTKSDKNPIEPILNRVQASGLITIDLLDFAPKQEILEVDLKDFLVNGFVLREKEFKESIDKFDFSSYENQIVALHCSVDAIIQQWAYMMLTSRFPHSCRVYFGSKIAVKQQVISETIRKLPLENYRDKRVLVRGCGEESVGDQSYVEITKRLAPVVRSLLYGEACSNVPILKRKKNEK